MKITLRQLEIFAAIAHGENVSRAAEALAMSQSAASSALVELERQFDCPLFDRIGKSLRLNSTGRGLLPQAHDLLARAANIEGYLAGGILGPLAVGATLTIGNYLATLVAAEYLRRHPASKIGLHVANTERIVEQVVGSELDIGLIEGEANHPDLLLEPWLDDALVVFCAPHHALATAGMADDATLIEQQWIVRERGSGTRALFDRVIARSLPALRIQLELEHTEAIKRAVESGLGVGCLSRLSLREAFRRGSLIEIKTPQFDLNRRFYFARHRQRQISPAAQTFLALCREATGTARGTDTLQLPFIS
ncbi:LysR family transcriptional regulator [Dechloromonas sp. A34]|uniref:LysR family transcriptional regulator n=1 Tax=Dechloromonas sp. A34 TaxID=447588 RepID=UPI0022494DCE|nr:LysR family transcriptional regulator [Dechloromonas sp. A34]